MAWDKFRNKPVRGKKIITQLLKECGHAKLPVETLRLAWSQIISNINITQPSLNAELYF